MHTRSGTTLATHNKISIQIQLLYTVDRVEINTALAALGNETAVAYPGIYERGAPEWVWGLGTSYGGLKAVTPVGVQGAEPPLGDLEVKPPRS